LYVFDNTICIYSQLYAYALVREPAKAKKGKLLDALHSQRPVHGATFTVAHVGAANRCHDDLNTYSRTS